MANQSSHQNECFLDVNLDHIRRDTATQDRINMTIEVAARPGPRSGFEYEVLITNDSVAQEPPQRFRGGFINLEIQDPKAFSRGSDPSQAPNLSKAVDSIPGV